jgi:hypothetical protein
MCAPSEEQVEVPVAAATPLLQVHSLAAHEMDVVGAWPLEADEAHDSDLDVPV